MSAMMCGMVAKGGGRWSIENCKLANAITIANANTQCHPSMTTRIRIDSAAAAACCRLCCHARYGRI